ncbi:MAG: tetratricopeptide repeat protein [Rhodothermales bacterium]
MRAPVVIAFLAAVAFGVYPISGCAQTPEEQSAEHALQTGDYPEARRLYKALLDAPDPATAEHTVGYFETFLATGDYRDGLRDIEARLAQTPDAPYLLSMKGRLLVAVGRYAEADQAFRKAGQQKPDYWRNALELADLLDLIGRRTQARRIYAALYNAYKQGEFTTAEELGIAGRSAAAMEDFHDANTAFRTAFQIDASDVQNLYWWADLFREKFNNADAQRTFEDALAINPNRADLFVGYARAFDSFARKEQLAREALAKNPNSVAAMNMLAGLRILDGRYQDAEAMLQRALAVNPASLEAMAHQASIHHLRGDSASFAEVERRALAINPRAGDFYIAISENLTLRFRYPDAVAVSRNAVRVDPENEKAYAAHGISLLRLGHSGEARRYLDYSFQQDPFNLFVGNTLTLLDEYADFSLLESEHFQLLIHASERDVLGPAILDEAEACYTALSARYPYAPPGKIFVEAYNDADDFAVRIAGVPHLGLLGVSFGNVIALNTPKAQAGTPYNWARTLWHELAHTMAIGVSKYHVPRWFTEGLSVYEEQRARPEWGREMDLELFSALDRDKLHPLEDIDKGFTRPEFPGQVLLSYYHASKIIAFIVEQHGFGAVTDLLAALGEGLDQETAFQRVLGQSRSAFDAAFRADLRRRRDRFDQVLTGMPDLLGDGDGDAPSLLERLTERSDNPLLQRLQEGRDALRDQRYGTAETRFREALDIYPEYIGPGNAYQGLAAVYRAQSEQAKLIDILERFLGISEYGAAETRELSDFFEEAGDLSQAIAYLERSLDTEPYDLPTYDRLAALHEQRETYDGAVRARRAILALNPVDKAKAYYDLALSLYKNNDLAAAKRAVLQSLELAPGFREAQKLLLACVDGPG